MRRWAIPLVAALLAASPAFAQKKAKPGAKKATTGMINIMSPAAGATVEVDGLEVGTVPVEPIEVGPGEHEVKVRKVGHMEFSETVNVGAGETVDLMADLIAVSGVVTIESTEPDSDVIIDGKSAGKTPMKERELFAGDHVLVVKKDGFAPYNQKLKVLAGGEYSFRATLVPRGEKQPPAVVTETTGVAAAASGGPAPAAAVGGGPASPAAPASPGMDSPFYTKWWFLLGAAAVVGGAVAGAIYFSPAQYEEKQHDDPNNQIEACGGAPCDVVIVPGIVRF